MSVIPFLARKKILVFGAGVTGKSVSNFLLEVSAHPLLIDEASSDGAARSIEGLDLGEFQLAVVSPGWRMDHPWIERTRAAGIEIISEIDLAWRVKLLLNPEQRWLALTGTNGKTTTVQMAEAMLLSSGMRARACGNVGDPVIEIVRDTTVDVLILELSSFQLSWSSEARFEASAILNIADDHIDWHGSFTAYANAKLKIADMSKLLIANLDDPILSTRLRDLTTPLITYSLNTPTPHQIGLVENLIVDRAFVTGEAEVLFELSDVNPAVPHNVSNAMAAAGLARAIGAEPKAITSAICEFRLDHHRLEVILESGGVTWIDDSKATNPHAALAALRSQISSIWIAGGLAKDAQMDDLVKEGSNRIKFAILIGRDGPLIAAALSRWAPEIEFQILEGSKKGIELMREVVALAKNRAESGDSVLLAPACASMDQFKNYAERGELFAAAVRELVDAK